MAEKLTMWRSEDGQLLQSESQCAAYELKRKIGIMGKAMEAIKFNEFGQVDTAAVEQLAKQIQDELTSYGDRLHSAIATETTVSEG